MHFAAAVARSNRCNRYTCPLHCLTLRCPPVRRGDIKVFAFIAPSSNQWYCFKRRMFTSDVRIPEFWIHILSAYHSASMLTSTSAITRFTVKSFAACDKAYCSLHYRFLVLFAMSFLNTQILIRKFSNIPTFSLRGVRWWPEIYNNTFELTPTKGVRRPLVPLSVSYANINGWLRR